MGTALSRRRVLTTIPTAVAVLALCAPPAANATPNVQVWTASAADRVFSTSTAPPGTPQVSLYAARGEQEAAQVVVRAGSAEAVTGVSLTASALTGPAGTRIPASSVVLRRAYDHPRVTVMKGDAQLPPGGGTRYYDALVENTRRDLPGGVTQPYHYAVTVPAAQNPGVYTGSVTVATGNAGAVVVPVRMSVYDVTVPPADRSTLRMNNWFTSAGWDYRGTENAIPLQYGVRIYDANWWRVIENIAKNHARHRNNVIHADFQALLIPDTTVGADGLPQFGWATFDRFVETFVAAGAMQYIHTPHLLEPTAGGTANVEILRPSGGTVQRVLVAPNSPEANAYLDRLFPALKAHLDAKGWTDRFYLSALDEPSTQAHVTAATWLYAKHRKYFPNPRTNEAHIAVLAGLDDDLTAVAPLLGHYEQRMGHYQTLRAEGTELWLYNCIGPTGDHMNRFISYHLAKTRLTPWLTWQVGGVGYLHWGWNFWYANLSDPTTPADTFDGQQTGDNWLVRPNKAAYDIYDSLRSETQLDGAEDYELLNLLARTKPLTARAIANSLVKDAVAYTRSGADVDARHRMILDELVNGVPDQRFPFTDTFDAGDGDWTRGGGTWSVTASGEYIQTDTSGWGFTATPKARAYRDVAATVDVKIDAVDPSGGDTNWAGLVVRGASATDMATGYLVGLRANGEVFVNRSGRDLGHATATRFRPGVYNRLRVLAFGDTLTVYVGDSPALTVTDTAFSAGHVALITGKASARFDNVSLNPENNVAEGGTVRSSGDHVADGWSPAALVDGRRTTTTASMGWSSAGGTTAERTESVTVDLRSPRVLGRIDLFPRGDGENTGTGFPIDFTVQVSANGTTWSTVASRTGFPRPGAGAQAFAFPTTTARYVRVTGTKLSSDRFGSFHMQLAEIEAYGGNLAAGRPVTASSSYESPGEGWRRAGLTDGNHLSTLWNSMGYSSAAGPAARTEWVGVDLGGPSRVSEVELYPRTDGAETGAGFPVDFTIQLSLDGVSWTMVVTRQGHARPDAAPQTFTFPSATARHVRVVATELRPDSRDAAHLQLAELRVG